MWKLVVGAIFVAIVLWLIVRAVRGPRLTRAQRIQQARDATKVDIKELTTYFTNFHRFQFVRSLPSTWSGLLLFNQHSADGSRIERKLVIKHSLTWTRDSVVVNELGYLRALRGSEHVVQIISLRGVPGGGSSTGIFGRSRSSILINRFLNMFFRRFRRRRPRSRASNASSSSGSSSGSGGSGTDPRSSTLDFSVFTSGLGSINSFSDEVSSSSSDSDDSGDSGGSGGSDGSGGRGGILGDRGPLLDRAYFILQFELGGTLSEWVGRDLGEDELWSIFLCRKCTP